MKRVLALAMCLLTSLTVSGNPAPANLQSPVEVENLHFIATQLNLHSHYAFRPVRSTNILLITNLDEGILQKHLIEAVATYGLQHPQFLPMITVASSLKGHQKSLSDYNIVVALTDDSTLRSLDLKSPALANTIFLAREGLNLSEDFLTVGTSHVLRPLVNEPTVDFYTLAWVQTSEGLMTESSATATLLVASGIAVLKSLEPELSALDILERTRKHSTFWYYGLSLPELGFGTTGPNCFHQARFEELPRHLSLLLDRGALFVHTTQGARLMLPYDPGLLAPHLQRRFRNDMYVVSPHGISVHSRHQTGHLPSDWVEVFQRPQGTGLCRPYQGSTINFSL